MKRLLLAAGIALLLLAGLAGTAYAGALGTPTFAPYQIPPQVPSPSTAQERSLLAGSSVTADGSWIIVHLAGKPYQIGFQNGYLTAQSSDYNIQQNIGTPGMDYRTTCDTVAQRYIWPLVPPQYRQELRGISDGMHAAGYTQDTLWDVVASNAYWDMNCYSTLLPSSDSVAAAAAATSAARPRTKTGCSAFIATGKATVDGRPMMGHDTWYYYGFAFMDDVMYYVHPTSGYDFTYQSGGGQIWSGLDWYENSAGLLLTETTLADSFYTPTGLPVFVRAREAAQYDATVAQAVDTLVTRNNGAYSNEWLIGDKTGEIASLQLGGKVYDLHETHNGFFGSCNFDWGAKTRAEEYAAGTGPGPSDPGEICYSRYLRWKELRKQYYGRIDAKIGMRMESDTYDILLGKVHSDLRDLCGEPDHFTPDMIPSEVGSSVFLCGDVDGKVCTEDMALHGLQSWACWGRGSGDHFNAAAFLAANPDWASLWDGWGDLGVFGLQTFSADSIDHWLPLKGDS